VFLRRPNASCLLADKSLGDLINCSAPAFWNLNSALGLVVILLVVAFYPIFFRFIELLTGRLAYFLNWNLSLINIFYLLTNFIFNYNIENKFKDENKIKTNIYRMTNN
jgi:hypothetical protein